MKSEAPLAAVLDTPSGNGMPIWGSWSNVSLVPASVVGDVTKLLEVPESEGPGFTSEGQELW